MRVMRLSFMRRGLAAGLAFGLVLAACAPGSSGTQQPAPKQEITLVQPSVDNSLDPQGSVARGSINIIFHVAEALTKITYDAQGQSKVEPSLALSWSAINDSTWQFKLRQGVKFHNGEPFDAEVVKYSVARQKDAANKFANARYVSKVESVQVVDPYTVNITTTTKPYPLLPLDLHQIFMVPPKYSAEAGLTKMALQPVGTGMFKFVEWVKDDHITLEANPDYWRGRPKLDKVVFKAIPEGSVRSAAFQTGAADVVIAIDGGAVDALRKQGLNVEGSPSARAVYVQLDQAKNPIMKSTKVRQALNYAVDKDAIVKNIFQGYATVLQGQGIPQSHNGFNPALKPYPFDPVKAKQLLAEGGYPNGFDMDLFTPRGNTLYDYETAQAIVGMLGNVGVRVNLKVLEWANFLTEWQAKRTTPASMQAIATYPDADAMFEHFVTGGARTYASVPEFDKYVLEERKTADPAKRLVLLQQAATVQREEAMAIWLYQLHNFVGINKRIDGFKIHPTEAFDLYGVSVK